MKLSIQKLPQVLRAYLKDKPTRDGIDLFKNNFRTLLDKINEEESEEHLKNLVSDFLKETWYKGEYEINTKERSDLVIHTGKNTKTPVGVIIEAKRPANKNEMLSKGKPNAKALHELILYYLHERIIGNNAEIKYLVATNIYEWYIFDANEFDKKIYGDSKIKKLFEQKGREGKDNTFFYDELSKRLEAIETDIACVYFDIREYEKTVRAKNKEEDKKLIQLYKIFSPSFLLKQRFQNDSNSLNKGFYNELLHLIGLEEVKDGGKKLIKRKEKGDEASLLENTISILEQEDSLKKLTNPHHFGETKEERLFNVALELCITWINRVLFLKLLEAQLLNYQKGNKEYKFLDDKYINDYGELNKLFFSVLAKRPNERTGSLAKKFAHVPYLNSSLFEISSLEDVTIKIRDLDNNLPLPVYSGTVLTDDKGKKRTGKLNPLQYLLEFLDAYDFTSEAKEEIQEDNKNLINASVLGLIFEKINGYKDGSFFTPGFITMYMCRETIRRAVVQKFNEAKGWKCEKFDELHNKIDDPKEANKIINSLKICDPAVGSGHFLVSALNEIIAIKSELKILTDRQGKRLKYYDVAVENDELVVTDEDGEPYEYNPKNKESQQVQEALFHEKQTIIENCLFGVDINHNSVKICRLRLWIELLKNAYYTEESKYTELETLPNIDINIKWGNSLISRFALDADLSKALKSLKWDIEAYKGFVHAYQNATDKEEKQGLEKMIDQIKKDFRVEINKNDKKYIALNKAKNELVSMTTQGQLFGMDEKKKKKFAEDIEKRTVDVDRLEKEIEDIKNSKIYENAFEWRFEFPEVLDNDGNFVGFDVVIGNPPYLSYYSRESVGIDSALEEFYNNTYAFLKEFSLKVRKNSLMFFLERGVSVLKKNGELTFINDLNLLETPSIPIRKFISVNYTIVEIISNLNVFAEVASGQAILSISKKNADVKTAFKYRKGLEDNGVVCLQEKINKDKNYEWVVHPLNKIILKIESIGQVLQSICDVKVGMNIGGVRERFMHSENSDNKFHRFINGGDNVSRYILTYPSEIQKKKGLLFVDFNKRVEKWIWDNRLGTPSIGETNERFLLPKLIIRQSDTRLSATYDDEKYHCDYNLFTVNSNSGSKQDLLIILAQLNSKLFTYFVIEKGYLNIKPGKTPQIRVSDIKSIPVAIFDGPGKAKCIQAVEEILVAKKKNPDADTTKLEKEIDEMVYRLYGLTEEEIKIVEGSN